ncbi:hypothetical protein WN59_03585 [Salinicoccus sediminis]|uniref:Zinc ribbon domain-containing protein n=1 Tax=Salinicoccus sediminis TaxID=1432562 RepID=A0A0M2SMJ8_9STAP|nr:DUF6320 domain-containing protein [Salinicoccus sediminis]KKK35899.1 hypothetical protein WN59_03585 [Salinicoccus sediminis]
MKQCEECRIWTSHAACPLCLGSMEGLSDGTEEKKYPSYMDRKFSRRRTPKMTMLAGITVILICLLINIVIMPQFLWIFHVAGAVMYMLVSFNHTILSKSHLGSKIVMQVMSLTILLLMIDSQSGAEFLSWSVNYVVPFLIISGMVMITSIVFFRRIKWSSYFSFMIMMLILGFLPAALFAAGITTVIWPSAVAAAYAVSVIIIMMLFAQQALLTQLGRRFHI